MAKLDNHNLYYIQIRLWVIAVTWIRMSWYLYLYKNNWIICICIYYWKLFMQFVINFFIYFWKMLLINRNGIILFHSQKIWDLVHWSRLCCSMAIIVCLWMLAFLILDLVFVVEVVLVAFRLFLLQVSFQREE